MKKIVVGVAMAVFSISAMAERVFDADGNIIKDDTKQGTALNPGWSQQTINNIKVVEHLAKQTPHYQEGYYAKLELLRQQKENDRILAERQAKADEIDRAERNTRANELNALANASQAYAAWSGMNRNIIIVH